MVKFGRRYVEAELCKHAPEVDLGDVAVVKEVEQLEGGQQRLVALLELGTQWRVHQYVARQ